MHDHVICGVGNMCNSSTGGLGLAWASLGSPVSSTDGLEVQMVNCTGLHLAGEEEASTDRTGMRYRVLADAIRALE